jgi:hypothetical protein
MIAGHVVESSVTVTASDAAQCAKLIRKLRWIGLDDEARRLELALRIVDCDHRTAVVAEPRITD